MRFKVTHGHSRGHISPTYTSWACMKSRCKNKTVRGYHNYGGRGIKVCERWLHSFENFLADMGERPDGCSLNRKDSNGNYEPGNCEWATTVQQGANRRTSKVLEFQGNKFCIREWSRRLGVCAGTLEKRILSGWSVERTLTEPVALSKPRQVYNGKPWTGGRRGKYAI